MVLLEETLKNRAPRTNDVQNNTTNDTVYNQRICRGWGYVVGDGVNWYITETVTLPITYDDTNYDLLITPIGYKDDSDPSSRTDLTIWTNLCAYGKIIGANSFTAGLADSTGVVIGNTRRVAYSWMTIGTKI